MPIPNTLQSFWAGFSMAHDGADETRFYDVCVFGDSAALADELNALVLRGVKRATAGSLSAYDDAGIRPPQAGDLSIVTTWSGQPLCVIETLSVEILPFNQVSAEFAATEGEGDGSLSYWREAHRQYFERECARAGRTFSESMLLACERFQVVYQAPPMPA